MMSTDDTLSVSRIIKASPQSVFQVLLDSTTMPAWRAPDGMKAEILAFEPRVGGAFRIALTYTTADHALPGKTSAHTDVACGRFRELVPGERIVEAIEFESDDPAMAGIMVLTTTLTPVPGGTEVTVAVRNAPAGVKPSDHELGVTLTLRNLANFVEHQ